MTRHDYQQRATHVAWPNCGRRRSSQSGFTLLEIVLALALAGVTMALLAQLVGLANQSAATARDLTKAQLIAQSIMAEFSAGVMTPQTTSGTWELDPSWVYEADVSPGASDNLSVITVTVTLDVDIPNPTSFTLTQFLYTAPEVEETEETDDTGSSEAGGAA